MSNQNDEGLKPSREQFIYANLLIIGVWAGIIMLFITYVIYLAGLLPPHVEISTIPGVWGKGVNEPARKGLSRSSDPAHPKHNGPPFPSAGSA